MKKFTLAALAVSLITGIASADPAARIAAFNKASDNGKSLTALLSWTNVLPGLVAAGWTDDALIAAGSPAAVIWAIKADGVPMSQTFANKMSANYDAREDNGNFHTAGNLVIQTFQITPTNARPLFMGAYENYLKSIYKDQPVRTAWVLSKAIACENVPFSFILTSSLAKASVEELITLRLAPELRTTDEVAIILDRATVGAKKTLRAEGKSFVVKTEVVNGVTNVVNPIAVKLAPVVTALNSPLMVGIEDALAGCGLTVSNHNAARSALGAKVDGWKNAILNGEINPGAQAPYLMALKVGLGVEEYNALVRAYNGEK